MAFKTIHGKSETARIDEKNKIMQGYLVGVKKNVGKFKSHIYSLREPNGSERGVWGCAAIDNALFPAKGHSPYMGCMVRFRYVGKKKIKGRREPMRVVEVDVDESDSLIGKASKK